MRMLFIGCCLIVVTGGCSRTASTSGSGSASVKKANAAAQPTGFDEVRTALSELNEAEGKAERFTPAFLRTIAPPETPEDGKTGFSLRKWNVYNGTFKGDLGVSRYWDDQVREKWSLGTSCMIVPCGDYVCFVRSVGTGADTKVDWVQHTRKHTVTPFESDPAKWTASAYLVALMDTQDTLAAGLMSPVYRANLAPVFSKADEARGYNPGTLADKLRTLRGTATTFEIDSVEGDTVKGKLVAPAGKRPFVLKLSNHGQPERFVESFECP